MHMHDGWLAVGKAGWLAGCMLVYGGWLLVELAGWLIMAPAGCW
jgi:hypothetical protein